MRQIVTYGGNFSQSTQGKFTKFYDETGSFEIIEDNSTGKEKHILYIGGSPYESNIILLKDYDKTTPSYYFLHKDYLGSILAISDINGNKIEQRHFDAWGNITHLKIGTNNVITDQNVIKQTQLLLDRGYTSHEHFQELGIIHMNGRLYDPILRRFLNADENIQDPFNSQNYNKYGYVLNNPLMYNDPTGEYIWWLPIAIAAFSHTLQSYVANQPMSIDGFMQTLIWSYIYSGVSFGIGEAFSMVKNVTTIITISKYTAHGVSGGLLSTVQGQNFGSGFISGIFGSIGGEYSLKYLGGGFGATAASGFILGGVGAELAGGNFWVGAVNGIAVSVFNHFEHSPDNEYRRENGEYVEVSKKGGDTTDYLLDSNGNTIQSKKVTIVEAFDDFSGEYSTYGLRMKTIGSGVEITFTDLVSMAAGGLSSKLGGAFSGIKNFFNSTKSVSKVYKHTYKYASRVRARGLQDPVAHNFPYSFDDQILKAKPIIQKDGSYFYKKSGYLNGKKGNFELIINKKTNTIFHRNFNSKK